MNEWIVTTNAGTVLTESGELRWRGICGPGGLKIKTFKTLTGAERAAARYADLPALGAKAEPVA